MAVWAVLMFYFNFMKWKWATYPDEICEKLWVKGGSEFKQGHDFLATPCTTTISLTWSSALHYMHIGRLNLFNLGSRIRRAPVRHACELPSRLDFLTLSPLGPWSLGPLVPCVHACTHLGSFDSWSSVPEWPCSIRLPSLRFDLTAWRTETQVLEKV